MQTQVSRNDQPDSYAVGENPAINNEEVSCLLVLLARVDSHEFCKQWHINRYVAFGLKKFALLSDGHFGVK